MKRHVVILTCFFLCSFSLLAQKPITYDLYKLLEQGKLEVTGRKAELLKDGDKTGIHLTSGPDGGIAWLTGVTFSNGTIELDLRGKDLLQQSFIGIAYYGVDKDTQDVIYFRPFNFRAADPVRKIHAVQYSSHPQYGWERLRTEQNGKFEKAVDPAPDPNQWFHTKIVVDNGHVTVYVNQNATPCLSVDELQNRKTGKFGLWVGNGSDGDFANLVITPK